VAGKSIPLAKTNRLIVVGDRLIDHIVNFTSISGGDGGKSVCCRWGAEAVPGVGELGTPWGWGGPRRVG
jgi:hypothetical protein